MVAERSSLDLYSTSQENECFSNLRCAYFAPYFAYQKDGKIYGLTQGSCNHWDCPRCGIYRAKMEYGRIVNGILLLSAATRICFITITCKGKSLSVAQAETQYLQWTNSFITACRTKAKRDNKDWHYVQVTEKQRRGHPHSHILTTFDPQDTFIGRKFGWATVDGEQQQVADYAFRSDWLQAQVIRSGLGEQYDISFVNSAAAASRYVAKYMFKDSMFGTHWPRGWKRVRYSQSFPKLPEKETNAFVLLSRSDWLKLASLAAIVITDSPQTKAEALYQLAGNDILVG